MTTTEEAALARFARFIDDGIAAHPVEARLIRKVRKALEKAGDPIVKVDDREEVTDVVTLRDVYEQAFNLDELFLITKSGSWVRLTMGEGYDVICDYTTDLEVALKPVFDYIEQHEG